MPSPKRNVFLDWMPLMPMLPPFGVIVKLALALPLESPKESLITLPGRRLTVASFFAFTLTLASILVLTPKELVTLI